MKKKWCLWKEGVLERVTSEERLKEGEEMSWAIPGGSTEGLRWDQLWHVSGTAKRLLCLGPSK